MSKLAALKGATTLHHVASLLNYEAKTLSYIVYKIHPALKYTEFKIAKRGGGARTINAPTASLKLLQQRLADLLQDCLEELETAGHRKNSASHGFRRDRSIFSNARLHRARGYVFNLDLEDFFPSIHLGRVRGFFIKDKHFALHEKVATVLAQIACHNGLLPQGSPCSPVISNLVAHVLDTHLVRLATKHGCTYTRYADDLTFSTNKPEFPEPIAKRVPGKPHQWTHGDALGKIVGGSGFKINAGKTRMQYHDSRQEVTGLVVNRKVNAKTEYRRLVRAMTHRLLNTGTFEVMGEVAGKKTMQSGRMAQLHGMLGFIDQVDLLDYRRELSALGMLGKEESSPENKARAHLEKEKLAFKELVYKQFLLFSQFYVASKPVIIGEGTTDSVYLVHAIRSLVGSLPFLATKSSNGEIALNVRLYRYFKRRKKKDAVGYSSVLSSTGRILGLKGGTGHIYDFILQYRGYLPRFHAPGAYEPVIVVLDNDDGAKDIFNYIKGVFKIPNPATEPFIHLEKNLYVVPVPLAGGAKAMAIEDLFPSSVTGTLVDGKSFNPDEKTKGPSHYGKVVFAHKVVRPSAATIDFSNFKQLLLNISAAIEAHRKKYPKPGP